MFDRIVQRYLTTNSYALSKPQWRVGLGAGLGVGHSYKLNISTALSA